MYAKVFSSIFDSSINEEDPVVFKVWIALLAFAQDGEGIVDMTRQAIANRTNLPLADVNRALDVLSSPDAMSRCPEHEGRRILPLPGRAFGWEIVTFSHYRELRRTSDRREYMRQYKAEQRGAATPVNAPEQSVNTSKHRLTVSTDTETETETKKRTRRRTSSPTVVIDGLTVDQHFEDRWSRYPRKEGKQDALSYFRASVRTADDLQRFDRALENYCQKLRAEKIAAKYVKHGGTFFNPKHWSDFVEWSPVIPPPNAPRPDGIGGLAL